MRIRLVLRAALPLVVGLGVMTTPVYAANPNPLKIQIKDACDQATFDANVAPGACVGNGTITFVHFLDEVTRVQRAPQWQFVPAQRHVKVGEPFQAVNMGGETHTFTEVEHFGGGIVPFLNGPAGFLTPAPECSDGTPGGPIANGSILLKPAPTFVGLAPGATYNDAEDATEIGRTVLYQCCIHPWMHEVITVDP